METAPSPAFSVCTPCPNSSIEDVGLMRDEFGVLYLDPESSTQKANVLPDEHAHLRQHQAIDSELNMSQALTTFHSHHVDAVGYSYSKILPGSIQDRPDSPEVLLWHF